MTHDYYSDRYSDDALDGRANIVSDETERRRLREQRHRFRALVPPRADIVDRADIGRGNAIEVDGIVWRQIAQSYRALRSRSVSPTLARSILYALGYETSTAFATVNFVSYRDLV